MAGILDIFGGGAPQGGLLGGAQTQAMPQWASSLGMIGAALKDASAGLQGRDSNSSAQFQDFQRQQMARQAMAGMQSSDPAARQQAASLFLSAGGDPATINAMQHYQAQQALPKLQAAMQPQINPVTVTPELTTATPKGQIAPTQQQRLAAMGPDTTTPTLQEALNQVNVPELTSEFLPRIAENQLASQTRISDAKAIGQLDAYTPIPEGDPAYAGYRKGTILGRNQVGDVKPLQQSDVMSDKAVQQKEEIARVERSAAIEAQMRMYGMTPGGDPSKNPMVANFGKNIIAGNSTLQNVPMPIRGAVSDWLQNVGKDQYSPTASRRYTLASSAITKQYTDQSGYKLTADAAPYLARINAAMKTPGSVSDQDILDSLTKLNTGGNAVTDAQIRIITDGKSYSDWASTIANKFKNGGVLSDNQRQQIAEIAGNIYANYRKSYQPIYDHASSQLTAAGIPKAFWTIPDLNTIGDEQMGNLGLTPGGKTAPPLAPPPGTPKPLGNPGGGKTRTGVGFTILPNG